MLNIDEARKLIAQEVRSAGRPRAKTIRLDSALGGALGRNLAEDIASDIDSPPHDKSVVDGYAVQAASISSAGAILDVLEEVTAGQVPTQPVKPGLATRIMTGAPLPEGATAVVMVERTKVSSHSPPRVELGEVPREGQNISRQASSIRKGDVVLSAGRRLGPADLGLLAEVGRTEVSVFDPPPEVVIMPTGNEIVPPATFPGPGQIRNSNGPMLAALVRQCGCFPVEVPITRDDEDELTRRIIGALKMPILLLSGGVSAGVLDLIPGVLAKLGVREVFHKVNLKPGKPIWFGVHNKEDGSPTFVFGLPGNPVSSFVCFEVFVRYAIGELTGNKRGMVACRSRLGADHHQRGGRPTYWPAKLAEDGCHVTPLSWKGSGDLKTLSDANCLAFFPGEDRVFAAGEEVTAYLL